MKKQVSFLISSIMLASTAFAATVTTQYSQKIVTIDDGKGPKTVRITEYSGPNKMSDKEIKALTENMQKRQQQMDKMMEHMMRSFSDDPFFRFSHVVQPNFNNVGNIPQISEEKLEKKDKKAWWEAAKKNRIKEKGEH